MKTIEEFADIVELYTWATGKPATQSGLVEKLESALDADDKPEIEIIAQNVLDEFQNRQKLLGPAYPFKTDGSKLELDHALPTGTTYLFCLGLSLLPAAQIETEQRCTQFETIVLNAAKSFFGGSGLRIGAPWRREGIPNYAALLDKVIELGRGLLMGGMLVGMSLLSKTSRTTCTPDLWRLGTVQQVGLIGREREWKHSPRSFGTSSKANT